MRLKLLSLVALTLAVLPIHLGSATRVNRTYTVVAGSAINVWTGSSTAANTDQPILCDRVFIQMQVGGSGLGYVMDGVPRGTIGSASNPAHRTATLAPATASAPGGSYSDAGGNAGGIDVSLMWIDGSNSGDTIKVSYVPRN